jgi:hypothetical protein
MMYTEYTLHVKRNSEFLIFTDMLIRVRTDVQNTLCLPIEFTRMMKLLFSPSLFKYADNSKVFPLLGSYAYLQVFYQSTTLQNSCLDQNSHSPTNLSLVSHPMTMIHF